MTTICDIEDLRRAARRRLPRAVFDTIDGGSGNEEAVRRNRLAFSRVAIVPRVLAGDSAPDPATSLCGCRSPQPFAIGPTGMTGLYWPRGELAMARAAARWSLIYTLSSISSVTLEEVAAETNAPKWFQLYLFEDDRLVMSLVERAAAAGYAALMVTVDTPVVGQRLRDIRSRLSIPPRPTPAFVASMLAHPSWSRPFFLGYRPQAANLAGHSGTAGYRGLPAFKRSARWTDIEAIRRAWPGRLIVKGVMTSDDVRHAAACGADAVVVSNHGGRQLDCSASPLAALRAIGSHDCELYLDGGIRSGSDVLKALALGARAVLLGRAPLFGLAAGGEPLASRAIEIIADDLRRAMTLAGCAGADDVGNVMVIDEPAGEYHAGP